MPSDPLSRTPRLTVVEGTAPAAAGPDRTAAATAAARDVDWSILMAHAQGGNAEAYRRLLEEVTPYLRSLAARWCRDAGEVEDAVQDVLLTVHAIRHTYDPTRPFGPWLAAIAGRRMVDRLRRSGRRRACETPLTAAHETFAGVPANHGEETVERRTLAAALDRCRSVSAMWNLGTAGLIAGLAGAFGRRLLAWAAAHLAPQQG